ncbi:otoferlin-like [Uloborus diversus]|uniref:otoferlin-like n=1 Tax=Uloborus diversus TaxID=327109 RepID=UPI00240A7423|nr:otoferlin-like [Uloborus diversus]
MALSLHVHSAQGFRNRAERIVKASFRGVSHYTKVLENSNGDVIFDQWFEWPVGSPVQSHEVLEIVLLNYNKYFSNKVIGSYGLVLQKLIEDGHLRVADSLVDVNNMPTEIVLLFDVRYSAPDGSVSEWGVSASEAGLEDDRQALLVIEHNIANLERSINQGHHPHRQQQSSLDYDVEYSPGLMRNGSNLSLISPRSPERKRSLPATMRSLASMMKLGKQRHHAEEDERKSLKDADQIEYGSTQTLNLRDNVFAAGSSDEEDRGTRSGGQEESSADVPYSINTPVVLKKPTLTEQESPAALRAQDFQVCVTIIEARHLAGLNMDPVVCVQVGDQKKYTSVKESTNCPYYNEYFVFDFHMAPMMFFDKIISLTVLHSRNIIRSGKVIGTFKLDVGTVFGQPDHQFYHKWALLTDTDDITAGPKGYLKCDISVAGKGDTVKPPPKSEKDEDDIEANLLLPDGVPAERQHARFILKVYRADGLPRMNAGIVANVKKAFTGEARDLVDPYVQVSFAGLMGKTSVRKGTCCPTWNEQVVFTEMFPPLCQRLKIQLRDNDPVNDAVIGTHFLDLAKISNEGEKGFLPTFGPSYIYLYGSPRDYSLFDEHTPLNDGLGEGVMYRGRILIALKTEILDTLDVTPSDVEIEMATPIAEGCYGRNDEFFLFGCVLEATMIDRKIGEKPIYFEITLGNAGNLLDSYRVNKRGDEDDVDSGSDSGEGSFYGEASCPIQSTTPPLKPATKDRQYYYLPYGDHKPCIWVRSIWQDHRRRLYNSNVLSKIADKLEEGLSDVQEMIRLEKPYADRRLRGVLEELSTGCNRFLTILKGAGGSASTKTKLDKERTKLCQRELDHIATISRTMKPLVTRNSIKEKLRTAQGFLKKIRELTEDPQPVLPDVFVWLISGGKRVAYQRLCARDLVFSIVEEESGKHCGKVQTLFLKLPGKKGSGPGGWSIQAKLHMYLWLGLTKHKKYFLKGLPKGYDDSSHEIRNAEKLQTAPPLSVRYAEKQVFELRCHMYQARSLIGSDSSGLSDPFARVLFSDISQTTQVIDETLSPTWDEMLLFSDVVVYGNQENIREDPPLVVVEIFDQDKVGKSEFIGRTLARPHVKFADEPYCRPRFPPTLEWYDIYRGSEQAGELLAAFELLQLSDSDEKGVGPELPRPKENVWRSDRGPILPVPLSIRPTLSKYRIEVLFWGLRELKRVHLMTVDRPRVDIECAGHVLQSSIILNYRKNPNFSTPVKYFDVELPDQELYCPPLTIRVMDCRSFGRFTLVGTHVINSLQRYVFKPQITQYSHTVSQTLLAVHSDDVVIDIDQGTKETLIILDYGGRQKYEPKDADGQPKKKKKKQTEEEALEDDEENKDWWTRYFASYEAMIKEKSEPPCSPSTMNGDVLGCQDDGFADETLSGKDARKAEKELIRLENQHQAGNLQIIPKRTLKGTSTAVRLAQRLSPKSHRKVMSEESLIKIYSCELENVIDFGGFREWLHSFELFRGKRTGDELEDQNRIVGVFKGSLKVYKTPLPKDVHDPYLPISDPQAGLFQGLPSNEPIHVLVRVYIVKATDLHPADLNGKADPYIVINLGSKKTNDKENYISKQLNPVFGKCFEFEATFPQDSLLNVQIYDWDLLGSDDLIGETKIDLENRFYSRHRPTCGLTQKYEVSGPNSWRDPLKPTQILAKLCKDLKLDGPYIMHNRIRIGNKAFTFQADGDMDGDGRPGEEQMALSVLHRWHEIPRAEYRLVPEHVETRPLYHPDKPGIEQGKLEMWVDMFAMDMPLPKPPTDISPRKPKSYELRVIIWNTDDVVLEDDAFFTGEKMSDIYVKGWLKGPEDTQCTDIHYRSLTGEGNFNWRFVYPFDYLPAEEKIVISRKESLFSWDETECKIPARLELQVWDADHFSADDFLGAITLDLNRFPRGAKSSKLCTLDMLRSDGSVPQVSLFKQRRIKGWWPFFIKKDNDEMELTGKVEAELHLLSKEEAEKNPAGLGRNEPDPLDKPHRPDSTFIWFLNPLKSIRYIIWHNYKWVILKAILFAALVLIILLFVYSLPGYTMKKMIGA